MPKVSIVLPNYNHASYLDERIQSLINQTYGDFELIILDDASTDNSTEVINHYTDDCRIRTQFYCQNSGSPFVQWNHGANLAQGEYLMIAEADDSCQPTLLERLVGKLDAEPSVGLAYCQSLNIDTEGKSLGTWKAYTDTLNSERWAKDFVDSGRNELQYLLLRNTIPNASAVLMRHNIFFKVGTSDTSLRLIADWMLWWKMMLISDIAFIAEPLNFFRTHADTVRGRAFEQLLNQIEEEYRGMGERLRSTQFSDELINTACDDLATRWVRRIVQEGRKTDFKRNFRIYRIASSIDTNIRRRLVKKLSRYLYKHMRKRFKSR